MKVKIRKKVEELFALPGKPGKRVEEEEFPDKVHAKAAEWSKEDDMTRKQAYGKAIGMYKDGKLEETYPHGGQAYGGSRIQDAEKEHEGHVERSKHQGLRNVMEELVDKYIDEEKVAAFEALASNNK